jgi:hypothetical protein
MSQAGDSDNLEPALRDRVWSLLTPVKSRDGHLTSDRCDDDGQLLARSVEPAISAAQSELRLPGDIADCLVARPTSAGAPSNQVADRLMHIVRHPDSGQLARPMQPGQLLDQLLDRRRPVPDLPHEPGFPVTASFRQRNRALQLCRIEGDKYFAMLSHGPSLHA